MTVNRYPDVAATRLREALAAKHDIDVEEIVVGPGSCGVLWQIADAYVAPGDEIVMHAPAFEAYPIVATKSQAQAIPVPLTHWRSDVEALAAAVTQRTRLVFLTDPHNPTGTVVPADHVRWLAETLADRCLLVVDQAYVDFTGRHDALATMFRRFPNVIVLRTFSKAHGLAALRIGTAFAAPQVATALRRVAPPFAVNGLALSAALASLHAESELTDRVGEVIDERQRLTAELAARGVDVPASEANFVFVPMGGRGMSVVRALERHGVVTRPIASHGIRVTIGRPDENDAFLAAWDAVHLADGSAAG